MRSHVCDHQGRPTRCTRARTRRRHPDRLHPRPARGNQLVDGGADHIIGYGVVHVPEARRLFREMSVEENLELECIIANLERERALMEARETLTDQRILDEVAAMEAPAWRYVEPEVEPLRTITATPWWFIE